MRGPKSEFLRTFGEKVRELRDERHLTQEKVAEKADLSWSYVSQVERGQHNLGIENLVKLARGLDVSPGELVNHLSVLD